jgi:hypothetical protein
MSGKPSEVASIETAVPDVAPDLPNTAYPSAVTGLEILFIFLAIILHPVPSEPVFIQSPLIVIKLSTGLKLLIPPFNSTLQSVIAPIAITLSESPQVPDITQFVIIPVPNVAGYIQSTNSESDTSPDTAVVDPDISRCSALMLVPDTAVVNAPLRIVRSPIQTKDIFALYPARSTTRV